MVRDQDLSAAMRAATHRQLGTTWRSFFVRGILALLLAVAALFWPEKTMTLLVKLLGVYFIFDGVVGSLSNYRGGGKRALYLQAAVSLAIGLVLLFWSDVSAKVFLMVVGLWTLLQGAGLLFSSRGMMVEPADRRLVAMIGLIVMVLGLVFIFWPNTALVAVSWLVGVSALLLSVLLLFMAMRLRRLRKDIADY